MSTGFKRVLLLGCVFAVGLVVGAVVAVVMALAFGIW